MIDHDRLNWRDFVRRPNPVASALMAKMNIAQEDRPRVKLECLRLLATLKLNPGKMQLISGFLETYLRLTARDQKRLHEQIVQLPQAEQEIVMHIDLVGTINGMKEMALRQLARRFRTVPTEIRDRIEMLDDTQVVGEFGEALLEFKTIDDAKAWLDEHRS